MKRGPESALSGPAFLEREKGFVFSLPANKRQDFLASRRSLLLSGGFRKDLAHPARAG
jgi:hypothetical protein